MKTDKYMCNKIINQTYWTVNTTEKLGYETLTSKDSFFHFTLILVDVEVTSLQGKFKIYLFI